MTGSMTFYETISFVLSEYFHFRLALSDVGAKNFYVYPSHTDVSTIFLVCF